MNKMRFATLKMIYVDAKKRYDLFKEEFDHINNIIKFLQEAPKDVSNSDDKTYMSVAFQNLSPIAEFIENRINNIRKRLLILEKILDDIKTRVDSKPNEKTILIIEKNLNDFFKEVSIIKFELDLITDDFNFIQRKIINIINSYPFYYPTPKVSSYKEASKIHFILEKISSDFLNLLMTQIDKGKYQAFNINTSFYWNFEKSITFIPDIILEKEDKKVINFVISSDSYLPYRRFHYILIFHECMHYYFKFLDKEHKIDLLGKECKDKEEIPDIYPKVFKNLRNYILEIDSTLNAFSISFDDILDVFIDSILSYTYGEEYYIPLFLHIFLFDEKIYFDPSSDRTWYVRLKSILNALRKINNTNWDRNILDCIDFVLSEYRRSQLEVLRKKAESLYLKEEGVIKVLESYILHFLKKNKNFLDILRKYENYEWMSLLLDYQKEYFKDILKNYYIAENKKFYEGRTLAVKLHRKLLKDEEVKYDISKVPQEELKVYSFNYIKVRAKSDFGKFLSDLKENTNKATDKLLFNYGSYSFLGILPEDIKNQGNFDESNYFFGNTELTYFTNRYELTLLNIGSGKEKFEEELKNISNSLLINMKILFNRNRNFKFKEFREQFEKQIKELEKIFEGIKLSVFYFVSFDWFDAFIVVIINCDDKLTFLDLSKFLQLLKEKIFHSDNIGIFIHRSESEIFIGNKVLEKIKIKNPKMQIRLSSGHSPDIVGKIKNLKNEYEFHMKYLYGIRDIEIEFSNEKILTDILNFVLHLLETSEDDISDIQYIPSVDIYN